MPIFLPLGIKDKKKRHFTPVKRPFGSAFTPTTPAPGETSVRSESPPSSLAPTPQGLTSTRFKGFTPSYSYDQPELPPEGVGLLPKVNRPAGTIGTIKNVGKTLIGKPLGAAGAGIGTAIGGTAKGVIGGLRAADRLTPFQDQQTTPEERAYDIQPPPREGLRFEDADAANVFKFAAALEENWQKQVREPIAGMALVALEQILPGKGEELLTKYGENRRAGLSINDAAKKAYNESKLPFGVAGIAELLTSPENIVFAGKPIGAAAKLGVQRAALAGEQAAGTKAGQAAIKFAKSETGAVGKGAGKKGMGLTSYDIEKLIDDKMDELMKQGKTFEEADKTPEVEALYKRRFALERQDMANLVTNIKQGLPKVDSELVNDILSRVYSVRKGDTGPAFAAKYFRDTLTEEGAKEAKAQVARIFMQDWAKGKGVDPDLILGPASGYTDAGKRELIAKFAEQAEQFHQTVEQGYGKTTLAREATGQANIAQAKAGQQALPEAGVAQKAGGYAYHKTTKEALSGISKEGMVQGDFTTGKVVDFPGDITLRVKESAIPEPQVGDYGGARWLLPNYGKGSIAAKDIEVKIGNKWVSLDKAVTPKGATKPATQISEATPKPSVESATKGATTPATEAAGAGKPPVKPPVGEGATAAPRPEPLPKLINKTTVERTATLRLSIRETKREGGGFLISGRDTKNRQVRIFASTLDEAKKIRENIKQGREATAFTEAEATANALRRAERKYRASLKTGESGKTERARLDLEQAQARSTQVSGEGGTPAKPPGPPSRISPDGSKVPPPDFEAARNKLINILRNSVRRTGKEMEALRAQTRKQKAAQAIGARERALATGESPLPGIRGAQKGALPELTLPEGERLTVDEVRILRERIYTELGPELTQTSANIEEALNALAFEGKLPIPSEMLWMEEIFGPELVESLLAFRTKGQKALEIALEAWNLPRSVLASFDDSMALRQGLHLLPEGAPAGRALKAHVKAITKAGADEVNLSIKENPWFNHGRAHGLDLTLPSLAKGIGGREEAFFGAGIARKIPILGKGVEISERVATAYLNKLRIETYAAHAAELKRMDAGFNAFKELADNINILSGRASLGRAQALAPYLNGMFFSARLNWARMQMPFRILRQVPNLGTPEGRHLAKMLARDVYGMWAAISGMVGLASTSGMAVVELDPRSSDFGKMQIGSVRVDPWAGQQQFAVLIARLITAERQTTTTRQTIPADSMDTLSRFIESKFHPALSQLLVFQRGENFVGEELTVQSYAKQWLPLFVQDIQEIASGTTPGMTAALGTAAFFGVSVYNIPGVPQSIIRQWQDQIDAYNAIPTDSLDLAPEQQSRDEYRESNPTAEAALFLSGQVTSLSTEEAIRIVERTILEHGINPDIISGIAERKERQRKAAAAGSELDGTGVDFLISELEARTGNQSQEVPSTPTPTTPSGRKFTPVNIPPGGATPTPMPLSPSGRKFTPVNIPVGAGAR